MFLEYNEWRIRITSVPPETIKKLLVFLIISGGIEVN